MIICKNTDTGELKTFKNVRSILREINRDRSQEWVNYNKHDWREGLEVFTEFELIKVVRGK